MANLSGMFDPTAEAQQDFSPLPSGQYNAQIVESELKPTNKNDGQYLELVYTVLDGEFKNRKVWARLNLDNPNATTVKIANEQLASIKQAVGVDPNESQSEALHYKPRSIRVEMIPAGTKQKNGYVTQKDSNEVKGWKKLDDGIPFATAPATPAAAPRQNAAPWANKAA